MQQLNLLGCTNSRGWSKPCSVWRIGWLCSFPASDKLFHVPLGHFPVQQQRADPRQRQVQTDSPLELLPAVRDELGLCDSKEQHFVACNKSLPGPSPSCSSSLGCMEEKAWFAGEGSQSTLGNTGHPSSPALPGSTRQVIYPDIFTGAH